MGSYVLLSDSIMVSIFKIYLALSKHVLWGIDKIYIK